MSEGLREELARLRGVQSGTTAVVARTLLEHLSHNSGLIDQALMHTAAAAVASGQCLGTWPSGLACLPRS